MDSFVACAARAAGVAGPVERYILCSGRECNNNYTVEYGVIEIGFLRVASSISKVACELRRHTDRTVDGRELSELLDLLSDCYRTAIGSDSQIAITIYRSYTLRVLYV